MLLTLPDALQLHVLVFVSLRDVRSLKAVCSAMLAHARTILGNAEWLSLHGASIGLMEGASAGTSTGSDVVGAAGDVVDIASIFTPVPAPAPPPAGELRACSKCGQSLGRASYGKRQWPKEERRCHPCLGQNPPVRHNAPATVEPLTLGACVVLPNGALCLSDLSARKLHLVTLRDEKLGEVVVSAGGGQLYAPRHLTCGNGKLFFTSKPADVSEATEQDHGPYPATVVGWCTIADLRPGTTVDPTVLEWDDALGGTTKEASVEVHGESLDIAVGAGMVFVLTGERRPGARPWEYYDGGGDDSEDEGGREYKVFVFKDGATRHHQSFSLGEYSFSDAPDQLVCLASTVLVNMRDSVHVFSLEGEPLRKVVPVIPPHLRRSPTCLGFEVEHLFSASGRLYLSDRSDLLVCSWDGAELTLLQSARTSERFDTLNTLVPMQRRARRAMRPCADESHVCMLSTMGGMAGDVAYSLTAQLFAVSGSRRVV